MKKIFTLAAIALFTMTSCSDNDSDATTNPGTNPVSDDVMLAKTLEDYGNGEIVTSIFTNDGNKALKVTTSDGELNIATYNANNQLVKINYTIDGEDSGEETFAYNSNNQLITYTSSDPESGLKKSVYNYNDDGTVSSVDYLNNVLQGSTVRTFSNQNLVKVVFTSAINIGYSETDIFTFDTKNDPTKNEISATASILAANYGGVNNVLTQTHTTSDGSGNYSSTYTYTYNTAGYPLTSVGEGVSTQYFYE